MSTSDSTNEVRASWEITADTLADRAFALNLHDAGLSQVRRLSLVLLVPWLLFLPYGLSFVKTNAPKAAPLLILVPIVLVLARLVTRPHFHAWRARRQASKHPHLGARTELHATEERLTLQTADVRSKASLSSYRKVVVGRRGLLLYVQPNVATWFPRAGFESDEAVERLVAWLVGVGVGVERG
ncbi:MAG: YcxB family protein [Acidobacteriota bacterium]